MKKRIELRRPRRIALFIIGSLVIFVGLLLVIVAIMNVATFGLFYASVLIAFGVISACLATVSIITNRPEWLLIGLLFE